MPAISAVFLILALWCNFTTPLNYPAGGHMNDPNADEEAHLGNVDRYASGRLPVFRDGDPDYEAHQPPLYYALAAPLARATRSLPRNLAAQIIRLPSILFGLALIWAAYFAVKTGFPESDPIAVGAAALVGLLPANIALAASITNDVLTNLIIAVDLWLLARLARASSAGDFATRFKRDAILLGVALGAGVLTKTSTLLMFPVTIVVLATLAARRAISPRDAARAGAIAVVLGLVIGGPWLVRNCLLYGDPVAQHIFLTAFRNTATHADWVTGKFTNGSPISEAVYWQLVSLWTFQSYWYKHDAVGMEPALQALPLVLTVALFVGAGLYLARRVRNAPPAEQALVAGYLALIALTAAAFIRFDTVFFQAQGRYLYLALVPLSYLGAAGLSELATRRWRAWALAGVAVVMALMAAFMIRNLADIYSVASLNP